MILASYPSASGEFLFTITIELQTIPSTVTASTPPSDADYTLGSTALVTSAFDVFAREPSWCVVNYVAEYNPVLPDPSLIVFDSATREFTV